MSTLVSSRVAAVVEILQGAIGEIGGISPPPVPPDALFPYVTVNEMADRELESLTGSSGLTNTIMQVNCWDKDYESAWAMRESVKLALLPFTGSAGSHLIRSCNYNVGAQLYDGVRELHQCIARFQIWWELNV